MFGSDIIDAAIGLFLVYFLFSVLCSTLNEWIVGHVRGLRAQMLEKAIERLLACPNSKQDFYNLPLIKCLAGSDDAKPSYISNGIFVDALLTLLRTQAAVAPPPADYAKLSGEGRKQFDAEAKATNEAAARDLSALLKLLQNRLPDLPVQPILLSLLSSAKDMEEARKKLEAWFDEGMNRATGWYKKHVQIWTACLAIGVVVFFNADTLMIVRELTNNARLRATLVASAEAAVKDSSATNSSGTASNTVAAVESKITELGLPIGWAWHTNAINSNSNPPAVERTLLRPGEDWLNKIGGLLVTVCAVSLGAPFWFDLLGKLINLRAAGKKPESGKDKK